jgi:hypothetical protein
MDKVGCYFELYLSMKIINKQVNKSEIPNPKFKITSPS